MFTHEFLLAVASVLLVLAALAAISGGAMLYAIRREVIRREADETARGNGFDRLFP